MSFSVGRPAKGKSGLGRPATGVQSGPDRKGGGPWLPLRLPGFANSQKNLWRTWLSPKTASGGFVDAWLAGEDDHGGGGAADPVFNGVNRPALLSNGVLAFDGALNAGSDTDIGTVSGAGIQSGGITLWGITRILVAGGTSKYIISNYAPISNNWAGYLLYKNSSNLHFQLWANNQSIGQLTANFPDAVCSFIAGYTPPSTPGGQGQIMVKVNSNNPEFANVSSFPAGSQDVFLGNRSDNNRPISGDMAEIGQWNGSPSADIVDKLSEHLAVNMAMVQAIM